MTEAEALNEAARALRLFETMASISATAGATTALAHWRETAEIVERVAARLADAPPVPEQERNSDG